MEYSLRERVIVIAGPLTTTVQSLMSGLTDEGADVALIDHEASKAEKFCAQLTDLREVKAKHGRAMAVNVDLMQFAQIKETVGSIAQAFGGIDVFIDAQLSNTPSPMQLDSLEMNLDGMINKNIKSTLLLTQAVAGFLKSRKKGRIIYLMNDSLLKANPADAWQIALRAGLVPFTQALAKQLMAHNVTANVLSLGMTEEYILARETGMSIKEAVEKYKLADPYCRITEPEKITNSVIYLAGPSGAAVTGQILRLT
jgi:2-hydroxycyclohexanecarboxyl-CoA dehydrogenase